LRARQVGLALLALGLVLLAARASQRAGIDFAVFHGAGARFARGLDLYGPYGSEAPFRYAPGIAALFAPLAAIPFGVAKALWIFACAAMAFGAALLLDARTGARSALAVPLAWLCLAQPLAQELAHGQVDLLVLLLALCAFVAEDRGWEVTAGALILVAAALKVAPAILALAWLVRGRWRPLLGCGIAAVLLALLLVPGYGLVGAAEQHVRWVTSQSSDAHAMIGTLANQSAWAWSRHVGLAGGGAVAVLVLLAIAASESRPGPRRDLLLAIVPLVSAYGWPQLFLLAVPLLAEVLARSSWTRWAGGAAAAGVSVLSYDVAGERVEGWAQQHKLLGALLVVLVLVGRFGAERRAWRPDR
jgi:alpha-1,2-mannosyltransferase